ncbi:MAG: 4-hydroxy-3-methylbut-2-enyl diphosphate reductase [Desulfobacteraceae bacterium]|nr:4-hydroxy-3-methylbut-2-enyl diphosphate reductase [Desulfobacteraceae bacterium]MDH3572937.1 4-hydroxy-3-methylbut-2-enyl diphosphate reductase [Desulfobacteraceae bacterium]MDH3719879.1 4-hydroxy-3-methylbut-2-enyl diphosphate reductase [Desulfobacteraceae bacterium]MDH3836321.1 4-hydroxy-3-methylbut-2-enyl diphosphate reductase [Desulfobacteraceae bacterium]MDH3873605.1 4-hydroxy-3-methylbut-2-enyl diphosphate reductase [Desulfobacteraceae bacterium]
MKILIAKKAGFCMGVRRAVEMVLDAPNKHENPICTFGPLIHNPQVLDLLREKDISILEHVPEYGTGTVLIRAHGVPPQTKQNLKKAGYKIIDATCPRVIKVQTIIRKHAQEDYASIIIGDKDHPEVIGLLGYAKGKGFVVDNLDDLDSLPLFEKAIIVAQTTQNTLFFEEIKKWANNKFPHYKIFDTICDSTAKRQAEVQNLADSVDAVIVVGGQNSGNTKRLAEISKKTGKPTYHIETESEIDVDALSEAKCIGITAGASTPNWVIKKIYRTLEALPYKKKQGLKKVIFSIQRVLLLTNIYVSIGAGCLCYACIKIQGITNNLYHVLISMLYVLSMHILNNLIGTKADRYNDPDRSSFYNKNKILLAFLAFTAGGIGLMTAYSVGWIPFLILFGMSIMGLSYNLRLIPKRFSYDKYSRLRDISGSKTVLIAMAWGIVTSVLPRFSVSGHIHLNTAIIFSWSLSLVFVRTAFFDILDMQGDRIVGKETIPILLGEKRTLRLLKTILTINFGILFISSAFQLISSLGFVLLICPVFVFFMLSAHERGYMLPGIRLEFLVESNFVMAGVLTLVWSLL